LIRHKTALLLFNGGASIIGNGQFLKIEMPVVRILHFIRILASRADKKTSKDAEFILSLFYPSTLHKTVANAFVKCYTKFLNI